MRRALAIVVCLLLLFGLAAADEKQPPPKPLTPERAADKVLEAVEAKDDAALKGLAGKDEPDPWVVAEKLCGRGEYDVAEAFARAAPRPATRTLESYVLTLRGRDDADARAALKQIDAARAANDMQAASRATARVTGPLDTVTRLLIALTRGAIWNFTNRPSEATQEYERAGRSARKLGWLAGSFRFFDTGGDWALAARLLPRAKDLKHAALEVATALGDERRIAKAHSGIGLSYGELGDSTRALRHQSQALERFRRAGSRRGTALALMRLGILHKQKGDFGEAGAHFQEALDIHRKSKNTFGVATAIGNLAVVAEATGRYDRALAQYEESLAMFRELKEVPSAMRTLGNLGSLRNQMGDYEQALLHFREELAFYVQQRNKAQQSSTLANIALVLVSQGKFAEAVASSEQAMKLAQATGYKPLLLHATSTAGALHKSLGNWSKAMDHQRAALALAEEIGDRRAGAWLLFSLGATHFRMGELQAATTRYTEALAAMRGATDPSGTARVLIGLGDAAAALGDHDAGLTHLKEALRLGREVGEPRIQSVALNRLSNVAWMRDDFDEAARLLQEAREVPGVESTPVEASTLGGLARVRLDQGRAREALSIAREAIGIVLVQTGQLSESEGAGARDFYSFAFEAGQEAATKLGDPAALLWFLEQSRAISLRESFASREGLQSAVLPPELRRNLTRATLRKRSALDAYRRARGNLKERRRARAALDEALAQMEGVSARIQREAKAAASLALPRPDDLAAIQARLAADEAMVVYGLTPRRCCALVLRASKARVVDLGAAGDVTRVLDGLLLSKDPYLEPAGVSAARRRIVEPLALGADVETVMICPAGRLGYVPFSLLLPDRRVTYLPSGTTHGLLRESSPASAGGVLALGDPDYRAAVPRLAPLPATRKEAQAVGDVVVLGAKASIGGFLAALAGRARWRAVHLACHGLVDPERPMRSSIALTPNQGDGGLLHGIDLLRLRIEADLVTLSACETARGRIYQTEGIVGLTRAFMFAGSPRVICSLWKVDDEATQALMIKFYELWNPQAKPGDPQRPKEVEGAEREGLGAAEALKKAQAFVRSHDKWKHPYYWAAWVLWGLPD